MIPSNKSKNRQRCSHRAVCMIVVHVSTTVEKCTGDLSGMLRIPIEQQYELFGRLCVMVLTECKYFAYNGTIAPGLRAG
jgi:hypothetical protein